MSIRYFVASVSILKLTVWPRLTLISVAKPSMLLSPIPSRLPCRPQTLTGVPGFWFSATMGLVAGAARVVSMGAAVVCVSVVVEGAVDSVEVWMAGCVVVSWLVVTGEAAAERVDATGAPDAGAVVPEGAAERVAGACRVPAASVPCDGA